eukprot:gnl/TRDRNA2_/TRDRNA2_84894_c0_seq1.p1 gnl/TRDRNA2_/TRDRNA2_84894_c0~~gnl/TRDRNA2_/TRDRNA2_84894_c0_seq1.p1  ORF type:complete len:259 (-),score=74.39 gnl/TRDRNA2_/TRDRNA2_84894_c0_seq1:88-822(-)
MSEGGDGKPSAHARLLEFAAAGLTGRGDAIPEELEDVIREVAKTGAVDSYPWESMRMLLARKAQSVLDDFWRDAPDVELREGDSFELAIVEPITRSLLEPRRAGAPFTAQRICELLSEPRRVYKSTKRFLYALHRSLVVEATEESLLNRSCRAAKTAAAPAKEDVAEAVPAVATVSSTEAAPASEPQAPAAATEPPTAAEPPAAAAEDGGAAAAGEEARGQKRKEPPEADAEAEDGAKKAKTEP